MSRVKARFTPPICQHATIVAQTQACVLAITALGMVGIAFGLLLLGPVARIEQTQLVLHHAELVLRGELP